MAIMIPNTRKDLPYLVRNSAVLKQIYETVHNGQNYIIIVNGIPQTGKSTLCLALAIALDEKFNIETHEAFTQIDFQRVNNENDYVGAVKIWEEAGLAEFGGNAREFWSEGNRDLSSLFQAMGFSHQICIINLPLKLMLDKHLRSLCHMIIETVRIDHKKKLIIAKVYTIHQPSHKTEPFKIYPRFIAKGALWRVKTITVPLPPKDLLRAYKLRSETFKHTLKNYLEAKSTIKQEVYGGNGNDKGEEIEIAVAKIAADPILFSREIGGGKNKKLRLDKSSIITTLGVSRDKASQIMSEFRRRYGLEVRVS